MANDRLKSLRAQVRKRRSAVTAKQNRIKRNTGVDIRGTAQDPRRPINVVDRYNQKQLLTYYRELDAFMSRSSGFVAGAGNVAIPKQDWLAYKRLEKKYNSIGAMHFEEIADNFIPTSGMTIRQRDATIIPDTVSAQGAIVNRPYHTIDRKPSNIKDAKALAKLTADMRKKIDASFLPAQIKNAREQLNQMLTVIGNDDLNSSANSLSDSQFNVLWNYTNFATNVSGIYFIMQKMTAGSSDSWYNSVVEDYSSDLRELFGWAATLPAETESTKRPKTSRTKKRK